MFSNPSEEDKRLAEAWKVLALWFASLDKPINAPLSEQKLEEADAPQD